MNQPILTTERLRLRPFCLEDADDIQRLAGNINVSQQTLSIPYPYESGMAEAWVETHPADWEARNRIIYAVTDIETNDLVGTVGFVRLDGQEAELGYWIGEEFWGKGYCTEAVRELMRFAFESLNVEEIVARHLTSNPASGKVMRKVGMQFTRTVYQPDRRQKTVSMEMYEVRKRGRRSPD